MKLYNYKDTYEGHTSTLSNINRNIAFAGIAIIWIFKKTESDKIVLDNELLLPLLLFIAGLIFEILHYGYQSVAWYIVFRNKEKEYQKRKLESNTTDDEFEHNYWITYPAWLFFTLKIFAVVTGYILLFLRLFDKLILT